MSTTAQKLKDFEDAIRSRAMQAAHPVKGFDVLLSEEEGCVTVQWTGQMPKAPVTGWFGAPKAKSPGKHAPKEQRCEAKVFFRASDTPPDAWPQDEGGSMLVKSPPKWPTHFNWQYVVIARSMSGRSPSAWEMVEPRGKKSSFASAGQCADYFIKSISQPEKTSEGLPLGGLLVGFIALAVVIGAIWVGADYLFADDDEQVAYENSYDSYSAFGSFEDGEDDQAYGGAGPRVTARGVGALSNSSTAEEGYDAGATGDESANGIASEGLEGVGGVDGATHEGLAGAAAGGVSGPVAFSELPFCWTDASGAPEPVLAAYRVPGGIRLEPSFPPSRAGQFATLPLEGLVFSHPLSVAEFEKLFEPVLLYSLDKGCRLAVQDMGASSPDLSVDAFRRALSGYFYIIP
ncbi:MAG: hypothetical protein EP340_08995 [Alphaproteobacteria bacterium]|nr:MAG: hypothetical protein EP340_08995 [Alphaproteobacteria bacterium]